MNIKLISVYHGSEDTNDGGDNKADNNNNNNSNNNIKDIKVLMKSNNNVLSWTTFLHWAFHTQTPNRDPGQDSKPSKTSKKVESG